MRGLPVFITSVLALAVAAAPAAAQSTGGAAATSASKKATVTSPKAKEADAGNGGTSATPPAPVAGETATIGPDGLASAPLSAPAEVHAAIAAANKLIGKPYKYGGGHAKVEDTGYDCSGTVSYALRGAGLLDEPLDSSSFMRWGESGPGQWFTIYTNPGHAFIVIAGLRLDTSAAGDPSGLKGPRWRPNLRSTRGFKARHIEGL